MWTVGSVASIGVMGLPVVCHVDLSHSMHRVSVDMVALICRLFVGTGLDKVSGRHGVESVAVDAVDRPRSFWQLARGTNR
jgi:hypothetical protein